MDPGNLFELEEVALDGLAGNVGVTDLGTYTADDWSGLYHSFG